MRYIQANNGTFGRHIVNEFENIRWNETNKTSVRKLSEDKRVEFGLFRLQLVTPPYFNATTQTRVEGDAVLVGDTWTQQWEIQEKYTDPVDRSNALLAKEEEDTTALAKAAREKRDALLAATDWVVLRAKELGQPVPLATFEYRGDLRQVPDQVGFPTTIIWPEEI